MAPVDHLDDDRGGTRPAHTRIVHRQDGSRNGTTGSPGSPDWPGCRWGCLLRPVGAVPLLLPRAALGRRRRAAGLADRLLPGPVRGPRHGAAPVGARAGRPARPRAARAAGPGGARDRRELGRVRPRRRHRSRPGGVAGVLRQPVADGPARRPRAARTAAARAVGGRRGGAGRGRRHHRGPGAAAVDGADPGRVLRHVRPAEEPAGPPGRGRGPADGADGRDGCPPRAGRRRARRPRRPPHLRGEGSLHTTLLVLAGRRRSCPSSCSRPRRPASR